MTKRHVIEILYTERCKFLPLAVERVRQALALRGTELDVEVRLVLVESFGEAVARRFRGSPTVRIDDQDVETRPGAVAPIGGVLMIAAWLLLIIAALRSQSANA